MATALTGVVNEKTVAITNGSGFKPTVKLL